MFGEKGVNSVVVELTSPRLERNTLSYRVKVLDGQLPASFKEASLFIDILGRWRMAAMGMAVGEARGMEMARTAPAPAPAAAPPPAAPVAAAPAATVPTTGSSGVTNKQAAAVAKLKELKSLLNQGLITQSQYQIPRSFSTRSLSDAAARQAGGNVTSSIQVIAP